MTLGELGLPPPELLALGGELGDALAQFGGVGFDGGQLTLESLKFGGETVPLAFLHNEFLLAVGKNRA